MPRIKPTTKIDVIGNLDLSPENAVGDFTASKQQAEFFVKPPNWDTAGDAIELIYIRNGREHQAMLRLHEEMLENQKRQSAINTVRIDRLHKNQLQLRRRFIEQNNFLREWDDKKKDGLKKIVAEMSKHEELKSNIVKYKKSISELDGFREMLKETVNEFEPYEQVIKEVVEKSEIFDSIKDCTDRVDALMLAQTEITRQEMEKLHEIEEVRKHMVKMTNEAALTVLGLKNDLAELERSYATQRLECLKWEKILAHAKNTLAENDLNKERALDGVQHIYRLLCKRRGIDTKHFRNSVEKQLDFIKEEVELLRAVVEECHKINKASKVDKESFEGHTEVKDSIKC